MTQCVMFTGGDKALLRRFVRLPAALYKGSDCYVPHFFTEQLDLLSSGGSMVLKDGPYVMFLCTRGGRDVGRVLAGVNRTRNEQRGLRDGYFALFECEDDEDTAALMMNNVHKWLSEQGVDRVTGPVSPTNGDDDRGVLLSGFDSMPAVGTAYTKDYYPRLLESLVYTKYLDFRAFSFSPDERIVELFTKISGRALRSTGAVISELDMKRLQSDLDDVHSVYTKAMLSQWEHLEIPTREQFCGEFEAMRRLIDPRLVLIARVDGLPVGFVAGIPDYNQVMHRLGGKKTPASLIKYALYKNGIDRVRMFMQFVVPEYQKSGIIAALYIALYESYTKAGYTCMEASTIAEFNNASLGMMTSAGFHESRVYRMYQRPLTAPDAGRSPIISLRGVKKSYVGGSGAYPVLKGIDLDIYEHELVMILGASGTGKTTLLNIMGGLDKTDSGSVLIDGQDISGLSEDELTAYRRGKVGFVFQFYSLMPNLTALENLDYIAELMPESMDSREALAKVGLAEKENSYPSQLSSGQQQRVAIARALVKKPRLILADEPTGALDLATGREVLAAMEEIVSSGSGTIVLITHNPEICRIADRVVYLKDGFVDRVEVNRDKISASQLRW